jgi:hypothetical protein
MNVMNHRLTRLTRLTAGALAALVLAGCSSDRKPVPNVGPRDSNSDVGMPEPVPIQYLDELVSEAGQWLAVELPNLPEVRSVDYQMVFAVPKTLETDIGLPDGRLRQTLSRLQAELMQSQTFTDSFLVINATELDAKQDIGTVGGRDLSGFRDPLQRDVDTTKPKTYNPALIYTMDGKFYQSVDYRSGRRAYHLFVRINKPQSRSSVLDRNFVFNLKWDAKKGRWQRDA